jgi:hypothetical protein
VTECASQAKASIGRSGSGRAQVGRQVHILGSHGTPAASVANSAPQYALLANAAGPLRFARVGRKYGDICHIVGIYARRRQTTATSQKPGKKRFAEGS